MKSFFAALPIAIAFSSALLDINLFERHSLHAPRTPTPRITAPAISKGRPTPANAEVIIPKPIIAKAEGNDAVSSREAPIVANNPLPIAVGVGSFSFVSLNSLKRALNLASFSTRLAIVSEFCCEGLVCDRRKAF